MIVSPEYWVSRIDISCVTRTKTSDTLSFGVPSSIGGGLILEEIVSEAYTCCFQTHFIRAMKQLTISGQKFQAKQLLNLPKKEGLFMLIVQERVVSFLVHSLKSIHFEQQGI